MSKKPALKPTHKTCVHHQSYSKPNMSRLDTVGYTNILFKIQWMAAHTKSMKSFKSKEIELCVAIIVKFTKTLQFLSKVHNKVKQTIDKSYAGPILMYQKDFYNLTNALAIIVKPQIMIIPKKTVLCTV